MNNLHRETSLSTPKRVALAKKLSSGQGAPAVRGEALPAPGPFFYSADSGLYRATACGFYRCSSHTSGDEELLANLPVSGRYSVDLRGTPVDRFQAKSLAGGACRGRDSTQQPAAARKSWWFWCVRLPQTFVDRQRSPIGRGRRLSCPIPAAGIAAAFMANSLVSF